MPRLPTCLPADLPACLLTSPQAFPEKLFAQGAAAAVAMYGGLMGVLLPARNPQNQRIVLALVVTTT